ncbi:MAG TPA: TRAP transporter substrate-binding protein [Burkholderiaceae bacterium]|jgi:TRAP-type transport system periplasmic protein|nr:TRAP transporter substrate-binding protein [Burkholderiaceae bacterium]
MRLRSLALAAALALGIQGGAYAQQQTVTLKFHTFMPPASNVWQNMHMAWMDKVEKESNGRIKFERFPAMQLGGTPLQLYDQARDGVADIVWTLAGNTPGRFPRVEVFELPFMMTNAEATSKAYWEYVQKHAKDEFKDTHLIAVHVHGPGFFHSRAKEIHNVSDLRGLKVRGPTRTITKMLGVLGATPVGMPLPQIPDALSKGVVDAVVIPWEVVPAVKVEELARSHSEFDPSAGGLYTTAFVLTMNRAKYESLPADLKKIIDQNSGLEVSGWLGKVQQAGDVPARKLAVEDRKNKVITIRGEALEGFRKAAIQLQDEWAKDMDSKNMNGKALLEDAKSLIKKHTAK